MTRKQYVRRLRELAIAIHAELTKEGSDYKIGDCLRNVKLFAERAKYIPKCYDDSWESFAEVRKHFGLQ